MIGNHRCDTCEKPATTTAIDLIEVQQPVTEAQNYIIWEQLGQATYGCDDHPVESEKHRRL